MNKVIVLITLLLAGCASAEVAKSWVGSDVDQLIIAWGGPDRDYVLPNGARELKYTHERLITGTSYYCVATFVAANGVVTKATIDGNLGGCNRLLGSKPARER